jgi:hypothetical protein
MAEFSCPFPSTDYACTRLVQLVLREVMLRVPTGVLIGIPLSLASSRLLQGFFWTQGNESIFVDHGHSAAGRGGGAGRIRSGNARGEG